MALKKAEVGIQIDPLKQARVTLKIIGNTPIYFNSMSLKAKRSLFLGGGKKSAAEKRELKHDPETEFWDSVYRQKDGSTFLGFPAPGIKAAMATAALVTQGVAKTDVQRLVFLPAYHIKIWGKPYLKCDVVRSADMAKTPDVRTRAFLPNWGAEVEIAFVAPNLSNHSVLALLANAGVVCGIGDFRQEKGKGSFGTFRVMDDQNPADRDAWNALMLEGRDVQKFAMENPEYADDETAELMEMMKAERLRRAA